MSPDMLKEYYEGVLKCLLYWYRRLCSSLLAGRVKLMKLIFLTLYQPIDEDFILRHAPNKLDFEILYRGPFSKTVSDVIQELVGKCIMEQFIEIGYEYPLHIYDLENVTEDTHNEGKRKIREILERLLRDELIEHVLKIYPGAGSEKVDSIVNRLLIKITDLIDERARTVVILYGDKETSKLEKASLRLIGIKYDDKAKYLRMNVEDVMQKIGKRLISSDIIVASELYIKKIMQSLNKLLSNKEGF